METYYLDNNIMEGEKSIARNNSWTDLMIRKRKIYYSSIYHKILKVFDLNIQKFIIIRYN